MSYFLVTISIALLVVSCSSNKAKEEAKTTADKDTIEVRAADVASNNLPKDTIVTKDTDLGGVGELSLGFGQTKITGLLGQPDSKSNAQEWGADGLIHQDWFYRSKGIIVNMNGEKSEGELTVFSITISSPCGFKTKKNMGIGSTYKDVMAAYEKDIDKSFTDKKSITVGSVYGGILFRFKNDKVEKIFIGAAAE